MRLFRHDGDFSADVFTQTLNVTGTVDLDGNFTGILDFDADGTATIATTKNLAGAVTTSAGDNTGIGQQVGAQTSPVAASTGPAPVRHKIRALVGEAAIREHSYGHH